MENVHIFGIRHHGPGSARSLVEALEGLRPDALLVEGPPDAQDVLEYAAREGLEPPVALLIYVEGEPQRAVFYPFAPYSPEWQAIQYGLAHGVPVRFMDLPQSHRLAAAETPGDSADSDATAPAEGETEAPHQAVDLRFDPLNHLAEIAGYEDGERWWDHVVESRRDGGAEVFQAVREAMTALREHHERDDTLEKRREAWMRSTIRGAQKDGFERIAVVCGAWHAPALQDLPPSAQDHALLKGLPRVKTKAAWVPWIVRSAGVPIRLWRRGGLAGVVPPPVGAARAGGALDDAGCAPAARGGPRCFVRARDRSRTPGGDSRDAARAGLAGPGRADGGSAGGRVRRGAGAARAHRAQAGGGQSPRQGARGHPRGAAAGRSRRAAEAAAVAAGGGREAIYDLDLRKPLDLERSQLLHRLRLLSIEWGRPMEQGGRKAGHVSRALAAALASRVRSPDDRRGALGQHRCRCHEQPCDRPGRQARAHRRAGRAPAAGRSSPILRWPSDASPAHPGQPRRGRPGRGRDDGRAAAARRHAPLRQRAQNRLAGARRASSTGWWRASASALPAACASLDDAAAERRWRADRRGRRRRRAARARGQCPRVAHGARPASRSRTACTPCWQAGSHACCTTRGRPATRTPRGASHLALSLANAPLAAAHWIEGFLRAAA